MVPQGDIAGGDVVQHGLIDTDILLSVTNGLRDLRDRIACSGVSDHRRRRWQRQLATIAETGSGDLDGALDRLQHLADEVGRAPRR